MGVRRALGQRKPHRQFQGLLAPETVAKLMETELKVGELKTTQFQFLVILVDETNPQETPAIISTVVETILTHGAIVSDITSSLVLGLLGVPFPDGNTAETRRRLADALLRGNGDRIRIAHGECDGPVGLLGSKKRCSYGALIPNFSGVLKTVLEAKAGSAVEV